MRSLRYSLAIVVVSAFAVSGCGGSSDAGPLDDALGYLPEDAPMVVTIDTDVEGDQVKAVQDLVEQLPFGHRIEDELEDRLEDGDVSFEDDVKPLLGNEFVVGVTDVSALAQSSGRPTMPIPEDEGFGNNHANGDKFVGAIQVKDEDKLKDLIEKEADEDGEVEGATIYKENGGDDAVAIKDDVLVVAATRIQLEDALEWRSQDDRLTEDEFEKSVKGLPENAPVKIGGDLRKLLRADSATAEAREVKWVDALRTYGATLSVKGARAELDFRLATEGGELTEDDLPFATGDESPPALDLPGEVGIGIRDPRQVVRFLEAVVEETEPGELEAAKRGLKGRLNIDVEEDLVDQMEDDVALSVSPRGDVSARIELQDEAAFRRTLAKIESTFPRSPVARPRPRIRCRRVRIPGSTRTRIRCTPSYRSTYSSLRYPRLTRFGDTTQIRTSITDSVAYKIEDGALLISNQLYRLSALERETPESVPGAKGSVSMKAEAGPLLLAVLRNSGLYYRLGPSGLGSLGLDDLTGSMRTSKDGLVGNVRIDLD